MSERKVLNKYYPPDFDPSKIPRVKCPKNRQFTVRLMAPFNMRCKTCGEYIYKGKKFNARKEDVEGEDYLGIRIFRFYIKCTRCLQEISFKTDPKNTDYEIEAGATRNFMALKLAEEQAEREEEERKEEEASNPMKVLENRTQQSKHELELLESLEELKDLNKRQQSVDYNALIGQVSSREMKEKLLKMQEEEDERTIRRAFGEKRVVEEVVVRESKKKKSNSQNNLTVEASKSEGSIVDSIFTVEASKSDTLDKSLISSEPSTSNRSDLCANPTNLANKAWNSRSVGSIKSNLTSLVKIKKKEDMVTKNGKEVDKNENVNNDKEVDKNENVNNDRGVEKSENMNDKKSQVNNKPNALSLLNSYSDSDGTESE